MTKFWQTFWSNYGPEQAITEDDLFKQVAQTVNKQPIPKEQFKLSLDYIWEKLQLSSEDRLVDLCCGNGLISYELAKHVGYVFGIDFVARNIVIAKEWKAAKNIVYILGDVTEPLETLIGENTFPNKYLMNGSLAYFEPSQFDTILKNIVRYMNGRPFQFFLTAIPCFDLKWNFYNTPERVARHLENEKKIKNTNDGLGRWWMSDEIDMIVSRQGLQVQITNQPQQLSNFRMDALISNS